VTSVLDEIPVAKGWVEFPFRAVARKVSEPGFPDLDPLSVYLGAGVVPRSSREDNHNQLGESIEKYQRVLPNDLVFNKLRTWQGGFGISSHEGIVSPAYIIARPNISIIEPRFLGYLLKSAPYLAELTRLSKWMPPSQFDIAWDSIRDLMLRTPPIEEQRRIADYLDDVSAKLRTSAEAIDQIVASLNNLYRGIAFDSLVAEVNFDPKLGFTVKAKNESWKQFPLHQVCAEVKNKIVGGGEDNLLSLSYGRIIRRSIESAEGLLPESFDGYNIIEQGDIVLRLTDLQNDQTSLRVGMSTEKGIITSAYTTIRPNGILPKFLGYQLKAFDAAKFFYALGGGLRQSMKYADLKNFRVMVPSLSEQEVIVADLDVRSAKILQLIQDFRAMKILVLEELSSLITAAVTGQFNVTTGRSVA